MLMMQSYSPPKPIKNIQFSGGLTLLLTIVEISDCLTRTIRNSFKPRLQNWVATELVFVEAQTSNTKVISWINFFFLGIISISVCRDMYVQALSITLMSVLLNVIIYDISKHGLCSKGPLQSIYVGEVKKPDKYWVLFHVAPKYR